MKRAVSIILMLALLVGVGGFCVGVKGFGGGNGNQSIVPTSNQNAPKIDDTSIVIDEKNADDEDKNSDIVIIRIEWDKLFVDDVKCEDIDELKAKLIDSGCKQVELIHKNAMKSEKDIVVEALKSIESALDIEINYNDN